MSENTNIEWAHHTFNPWSGCNQISAGCKHCYAKNLPPAMRRHAQWGPTGTRPLASESYMRQPLAWDRKAAKMGERHRVFMGSTMDIGEEFPGHLMGMGKRRGDALDLIRQTPNLDWLLVTKRPGTLGRVLAGHFGPDLPPNLWVLASVEDQATADERIPELLGIPAAVRGLSMEPLLGPVDLGMMSPEDSGLIEYDRDGRPAGPIAGPRRDLLHWVIVGGESGRNARPMHPDWARSIRDQCQAAGVAFHFKQAGEWTWDDPRLLVVPGMWTECRRIDLSGSDTDVLHYPHAAMMWRIGKKAAGRLLDGRTWDEFPA